MQLTLWTNRKVILMNYVEGVTIYPSYTPFAVGKVTKQLELYIINEIVPPPQVDMKLR